MGLRTLEIFYCFSSETYFRRQNLTSYVRRSIMTDQSQASNHQEDTIKLTKRPKLVAWANHWHAHKRVQLKSVVLTSKTPAVIGSDKRKTHRSGWKEKAAVKENQLIQREPPCLEGGKFIWLLSNCILFFRSSCYGDGDSLMIPFWSLTLSQKKKTLTQYCFNIVPASATLAKY